MKTVTKALGIFRNLLIAVAVILALLTLLDINTTQQEGSDQGVIVAATMLLASFMIIPVLIVAGICQGIIVLIRRRKSNKIPQQVNYDPRQVADNWGSTGKPIQ